MVRKTVVRIDHSVRPGRTGSVDGVLLAAASDPTGLSSPVGQIAIIAVLVAALVTGVRALWQRRNRR
jgi:hypothetical protein